MSARWSLGILVGLPFVALGVLCLSALIVFGLRNIRRDGWKDTDIDMLNGWVIVSACASLALLVLLIGSAFAYYPWVGEYHKWQPTSGTVTAVSNRFLGDGKSTTQRFVVTLDGVGSRACDDTRCALVKVGDHLTLSCKRHWQWSGTPGYDCNYVKDERS